MRSIDHDPTVIDRLKRRENDGANRVATWATCCRCHRSLSSQASYYCHVLQTVYTPAPSFLYFCEGCKPTPYRETN